MTTVTFSLPTWVIYLSLIACLLGFLLYASKLVCNIISMYSKYKHNRLEKKLEKENDKHKLSIYSSRCLL